MTRVFWVMLIVFVSVNLAIQITGNTYMYRALLYNYADIDDLDVFDTRIVKNDSVEEWPLAANYNKLKLPDTTLYELKKNQSVEFVVIKNDSVLYEQYWD